MYSGQSYTLDGTVEWEQGSRHRAFSLIEVLAALAILAFISSSVLVVIDRCIGATADSALQMEAFNLVHEHMETILASESIKEDVEYGTSERYPDMTWRTVTEPFSESVTGQTWIRAVCSAQYTDSKDEDQTVELVDWVTALSDKQADQLAGGQDIEALAAEQLIDSVDSAAEYAGVKPETIELWMDNGLLTTDDGSFIQYNLDIYITNKGDPTQDQKDQQVKSVDDLAALLAAEGGGTTDDATQEQDGNEP